MQIMAWELQRTRGGHFRDRGPSEEAALVPEFQS